MMLRAPGMFLGALVMAFWMNAELAAVILVVIPLLTAAIVWILRTAYPRFTAMQKALDTLNSGIQEVLTNGAGGEILCAGRLRGKAVCRHEPGAQGGRAAGAEDRNCDDAGHDVRDECDDTGSCLVRRKS